MSAQYRALLGVGLWRSRMPSIEAGADFMDDADKIVAAILATGLAKIEGAAKPENFVRAYEEILSEMTRREKVKVGGSVGAHEEQSKNPRKGS
jgi:hypothetical protein